ncbi:hypothetical protein [Paracidobacterium acidisoli]|uniref:Uncharacterized protein n=1 Tax=Paracidobacterium acidisoli TaxID=2303751 RepID=A0A372ITX2_9BACT|nr:hypothetical protein [Paracidobacterium acidisoli]MBT9329824.1 DUF5082 domain-containing protein [Paracidobacterium acidisoli]
MNTNLKVFATLLLASTVAVGYAQSTADSAGSTAHKATAKRTHHRVVEKKPSVESQIEELRNELNEQHGQIDTLKQQLSDRDAQLQQAQQAASQAQTAAQQAQQAASQEQQQLSDNSAAVSSLKDSVSDLKSNTTSIVGTLQEQQASVKKAIEHPDAIHFKGVTISPTGSFIEAATVWRSAATGDDINTHFTAIPLENSGQAQLSEFYGSGRQSRLVIKAVGHAGNATLTGYYEMDWLGAGVTSNNNQSNSYVIRQRQLWAQAALHNGWTFTGGQMWSLTTETTHGLDNGTEILPGVIDPQYTAGFVWNRQYGFRVSKDFGNKVWIGAAAENDQALPGGSSPTNQFLGQAGDTGGLYDNQSNYSYNLAPEMVAKVAFEPGWGHYELFGVARFFQNRVYPSSTTAAGAYNDSTVGGGIGGGFRVPLAHKKLSVGLKGLWGDGVGRMGDSTIADLTFRSDGQMSLLHTFSALSTLEASPTKRLSLYFNYGGDYVGRDLLNGGKSGYGLYSADMSGCNTEGLPAGSYTPSATGNCKGNNKDVQEFSSGYWYNFYDGSMGRLRQGIQYSYIRRDLWSGTGGPLNPDGGAKGTDNIFETSLRYYLP